MSIANVDRVRKHSSDHATEEIQKQTEAYVVNSSAQGAEGIDRRLAELNSEWDIERTLETHAATAILVGTALGAFVERRWLVVPALVAGFLIQHALQGWCPPLALFRRLGVRTSAEIDRERYALKALRGDFESSGGVDEENSALGAFEAACP